MQKHYRLTIAAFLSAVIFFSSCSKTNKQGRSIPENALVAIVVNGETMSAKLPWDEVKQNSLLTNLASDSTVPAFIKKALDNPDNTGIDTKKDLLFFVVKDSSGGYGAFSGTIKDGEKFRQFALEAAQGGNEVEKEGVKTISKGKFIAGYDKDKFLCMVDMPQLNKASYFSNDAGEKKARDLSATLMSVFNLSEKNSLGDNEKFTTMVKEKGDIHFWFNTAEMYKDMPGTGMFKMDKLYEGNLTAATVNFENGKILVSSKSYTNKEMAAVWKKYKGSSIDENMIKSIPATDLAFVLAMNFKPEGINEMLKVAGIDGMVSMATVFLGISVDEFIKANKGDVMIAVSDFKPSEKKYDSLDQRSVKGPEPDVLFAASIGDKDAFNSLIKTAKRLSKEEMNDSDAAKVAYNMNSKYFAIGNNKTNVDKFITGGNNNFEFLKKLSGNPFGAYINAQYIMRSMESEVGKDSTEKIIYDLSLKMFQDAYFTGGQFSDGGISSDVEINLMDKNTNSLKQLNQYLGKVAQIGKEREEKKKAEWLLNPPTTVMDVKDAKIEVLKDNKQVPPPPPPAKRN